MINYLYHWLHVNTHVRCLSVGLSIFRFLLPKTKLFIITPYSCQKDEWYIFITIKAPVMICFVIQSKENKISFHYSEVCHLRCAIWGVPSEVCHPRCVFKLYGEVEWKRNLMAHGDARYEKWRGNRRMVWVASTHALYGNTVYPALLPLMCTPRLPAADWTDTPADINGLVRFAGRPNLVSARVPSHSVSTLQPDMPHMTIYYDACAMHAG